MKQWKLKQKKQCKNCPWRKQAKKSQIPNYSKSLHEGLKDTIASDNTLEQLNEFAQSQTVKIMACHNSSKTELYHCIGWVYNQLGTGNNIALRISFMNCKNSDEIEIDGEQHTCFKDTFCEKE